MLVIGSASSVGWSVSDTSGPEQGCRAGRKRRWRRSNRWIHRLQRLDDQYPGLLTGGISTLPRSADYSPSRVVARRLEG